MRTFTARLLDASDDAAVDALLARVPQSLLYATPRWRAVLQTLCPAAVEHSVGVFDDHELVGLLPGLVLPGPYGAVFNSLPFFGSNGGVVADVTQPWDRIAARAARTLDATLAARGDVIASTVIASPFAPQPEAYRALLRPTALDRRIGQVTALPATSDAESLLARVHPKTRSAVRVAQRSGVVCAQEHDEAAWRALHALHAAGMEALGGTVKPWRVFATLRSQLEPHGQCALYTARQDDTIVAALLVLQHGQVAEYFTPATLAGARALQPMSGLIVLAMQHAIARGARWWNWGGTWASQEGVHRFKARWAAEDRPYEYFVRVHAPDALAGRTPTDLAQAYPWFYVVPYGAVTTSSLPDAGSASTRLPNVEPA